MVDYIFILAVVAFFVWQIIVEIKAPCIYIPPMFFKPEKEIPSVR